MKPLMLPDQKKKLTFINDQMIAAYLQENEVEVIGPYVSGFHGLSCNSCGKPWNFTFHKLRFNKVKCPSCFKKKLNRKGFLY